jgi:hypothetical protein
MRALAELVIDVDRSGVGTVVCHCVPAGGTAQGVTSQQRDSIKGKTGSSHVSFGGEAEGFRSIRGLLVFDPELTCPSAAHLAFSGEE